MVVQSNFVQAGEFNDPTRPLVSETQPVVDNQVKTVLPRLGFVLIAQDRRIAIIDGRRYEENDWLNSYRIANISKDRVILVDGTKKIELQLNSTGIKERQR